MDGQQIFDIRSYDKHLSQIHMQDIQGVMRILKLKEKYQLSHSLIPNVNIEELNKEIHTILDKNN
ncbi:hypothetical protein [Ureibacillus sp. FSL W8-0352]|uniref:hypothetical protein n=1 Tax=Ureibacillus sp. FSL W8-0352 TaxID=2954596 RepID=UPI0030F74A88